MSLRAVGTVILAVTVSATASSCAWRGLNSVALPGTAGGGPGSYTVQVELPNVVNLQQNSRVRVGDVNVGNVTRVERQGWHALVTMSLNQDVDLPANATATLGQTSLLGSLHVELAAPTTTAPTGQLREGAVIPLSSGGAYPTTEQTLSAVSLLLNGGGLGQVQDITTAFATAFGGREQDLRKLIEQLDVFVRQLDDQKNDIIGATESLNGLVAKFADQKPVLDRALDTVPGAIATLSNRRDQLTEMLNQFGQFGALTANAVTQTKENLVKELSELGSVVKSLADAGPDMTRALSLLATFPFPKELIGNWQRGDYANMSVIIDLTLSRLDTSYFTGTRFEGDLTRLELQWGRTIGQMPSPATAGNPLVAPYNFNQGP